MTFQKLSSNDCQALNFLLLISFACSLWLRNRFSCDIFPEKCLKSPKKGLFLWIFKITFFKAQTSNWKIFSWHELLQNTSKLSLWGILRGISGYYPSDGPKSLTDCCDRSWSEMQRFEKFLTSIFSYIFINSVLTLQPSNLAW